MELTVSRIKRKNASDRSIDKIEATLEEQELHNLKAGILIIPCI